MSASSAGAMGPIQIPSGVMSANPENPMPTGWEVSRAAVRSGIAWVAPNRIEPLTLPAAAGTDGMDETDRALVM
jgi:hypothetical protein